MGQSLGTGDRSENSLYIYKLYNNNGWRYIYVLKYTVYKSSWEACNEKKASFELFMTTQFFTHIHSILHIAHRKRSATIMQVPCFLFMRKVLNDPKFSLKNIFFIVF